MRRLRWLLIGLATLAAAAWGLDRLLPPDTGRWLDRSPVLLAMDGSTLNVAITRDGKWRLATRPDDVDPRYRAMLLAAEDQRFPAHPGVDPLALLRAAWQFAGNGRIVSGGSTLTMQVARLLEPHGRSWSGKLHDVIRAVQLEARYGKDDILAMYLTLAPFGGNLEGVRAASLAWFGHEPNRLTAGEAAILVALPQRPAALRPDRHPAAAQAAAERLLQRLVAANRVDPADRETAPPAIATRHGFPRLAEHVARRLRHAVADGAGSRSTADGTPVRTTDTGAPVRTTLDPQVQPAIERLAADLAGTMADGGDIAILVVDNRDRSVRAWVGGVHSYLDLARRRRSPGSTLKPFIYGLAFDDLALLPETMIADRPVRIGMYAPENFDRGFHGEVSAREALQQSLNVPAITVLDRVGPGRLAATLRAAGARLAFPAGDAAPSLPLALGGVGITLADLTQLYTGLARDGRVVPLHLVPQTARLDATLMTASAARMITDILRGSPPPDGRMPGALAAEARPIAYKTGTSYGFRDAWAVGYSPSWTVGIWTGRADGTPRPGAYGRNTAAPALFRAFDLLPAETLPDPLAPRDAEAIATPRPIPRALRHFADHDAQHALARAAPPRIMFPPDGAELDLERDNGSAGATQVGIPRLGALQLQASSGTPPYRWSVNGVPIAVPNDGMAAQWQPDGPGFARVTVTDAAGRRSSATIRVR